MSAPLLVLEPGLRLALADLRRPVQLNDALRIRDLADCLVDLNAERPGVLDDLLSPHAGSYLELWQQGGHRIAEQQETVVLSYATYGPEPDGRCLLHRIAYLLEAASDVDNSATQFSLAGLDLRWLADAQIRIHDRLDWVPPECPGMDRVSLLPLTLLELLQVIFHEMSWFGAPGNTSFEKHLSRAGPFESLQ